ncbi:uncharacterized protein LOC129592682 [Paramacrobiotus metropolitanus]|uniref:uncharacterized protein LOC129592682 n=1 Tax=Paramacrobiotus metropolitanus TaxID=2943436 RepID=UPI0024456E90|nr:uncharacterized protein LOC129592682 [Paramacrobiotus metropolitanus]
METQTLNSSKAIISCLVLQFILGFFIPVTGASFGILTRIYTRYALFGRTMLLLLVSCLYSITAASLGFHMLLRRIRSSSYMEILALLNIISSCLTAMALGCQILGLGTLLVRSPLSWEAWLFGLLMLLPPIVLMSITIYVAVQARNISGMAAKREEVKILC